MARAMLPIDDPWLVGFVATSLTLGLATLSWWMLERPVLRLKDRFDYPAPRESERP
jgi:peptidoglycan/LPS O-acetylase OafA/YrhL